MLLGSLKAIKDKWKYIPIHLGKSNTIRKGIPILQLEGTCAFVRTQDVSGRFYCTCTGGKNFCALFYW